MPRRGRQNTQAPANGQGRSRSRGGGGPQQAKHNNHQQNPNKPRENSRENLHSNAQKLLTQINRLRADHASQLAPVRFSASDTEAEVKIKLKSNYQILNSQYTNETFVEMQTADIQHVAWEAAIQLAESKNADQKNTVACIENLRSTKMKCKAMHDTYKDALLDNMKIVAGMYACASEDLVGTDGHHCGMGGLTELSKGVNEQEQKRKEIIFNYIKDFKKLKMDTTSFLNVKPYDEYKKEARQTLHDQSPEKYPLPANLCKMKKLNPNGGFASLGDMEASMESMNLSANSRGLLLGEAKGDQPRSSASLRYL